MMRNFFFKLIGIVFLILARLKNLLLGYSTPKPFSVKEYEKCIEYDFKVADNWLAFLKKYTGRDDLRNKNILELGPGSDLGIGLYLLSKGAFQYNAIDFVNLVSQVPQEFYERFFKELSQKELKTDIESLRHQLKLTQQNKNDKLNYVCRQDFDLISAFEQKSVDIVFSRASFEHFENMEKLVRELSQIVKAKAIIVAQIDLQTHSRWIREKDPNNIYRYSEAFYNLFRFRSSPNRLRPYQYKEIFEKNGWEDIEIIPLKKLEQKKISQISLNKKFKDEKNQMDYLEIVFLARKQ